MVRLMSDDTMNPADALAVNAILAYARHSRVLHRSRSDRGGFTLLEILLVLSLLVLLAGLAWPLMENRLSSSQLPETAERFRSVMYLTRSAAMMEHRRHRIRFEPSVRLPFIEIEPDPVLRPGEFVEVTEEWALDPPLLDGVHVHDVIPGRPAYLKPYSTQSQESMELIGVESTSDLNSGQEPEADGGLRSANITKDEKSDEKRPSIVFSPDGTTDWATIVLSDISSDEPLTSADRQYWVVVDGRTGLAKVQEGLSEEQVASTDFTVSREKLYPPKKTDINDLTLNITSDSGAGGLSGMSGGGSLMSGGMSGGAGVPMGMGAGSGPKGFKPEKPRFPGDGPQHGERPERRGPGFPGDRSHEQPNVDEEKQPPKEELKADTMEELEEKLANSDLTEEEKERIRQSFQKQQSPGQ